MLLTAARRAYLDELHYAVIATVNADNSIQQTVVWYVLDDSDEIRFSVGANSVKVRNLVRNPTISVMIADGKRYLTLQGQATVETFDPDLRRRLALRYLGPEGAEVWLQRRPDAPRMSVRVRLEKAYGQGV
ncbi:TIGR03618 family F420-dependent PPOX class oxidoreductase [Candidatus Oscillochloris fontis]|uniref:TIGR03618 family F420-dependent PPOX class oxidoreductase n=1 Tax=Candidatus Oscillochloris fontis TaxID=2496868 RepID=UPI00101C46B3|nr:TIGR03618 family F420-dependent PPOX class oxidoreductase [Candidatus Oscillochloris fontis]